MRNMIVEKKLYKNEKAMSMVELRFIYTIKIDNEKKYKEPYYTFARTFV